MSYTWARLRKLAKEEDEHRLQILLEGMPLQTYVKQLFRLI